MYSKCFKRPFDIIGSFCLFIISLPLIFIIILILFFLNEGKVFFIQERPGLNLKGFKIIKFKTMNDSKDNNGILLPNKYRLTPIGIFLRKFSLDEIPQLVNIIKGEMSLIGPRPLLMDYIPFFNDFQKRRQTVRPGMTGWAQVNGRNAISWEEKFVLDIWYVEHLSFSLDLKILLLTLIKAIKHEGISHHGDITMPRFSGNDVK